MFTSKGANARDVLLFIPKNNEIRFRYHDWTDVTGAETCLEPCEVVAIARHMGTGTFSEQKGVCVIRSLLNGRESSRFPKGTKDLAKQQQCL